MLGQSSQERARGVEICTAAVSDLLGVDVRGSHGSGIRGYELDCECMGFEGVVSVLEVGGPERKRKGLVLGGCLAVANLDGVGYGAQEGILGRPLEARIWRGRRG